MGTMQRRPPARLADVARLARVSTATASRTLSQPASVNAETRMRVLEAVRALGYTPNVAARNLRARTTRMVLVVVDNIGNSFFTDVLRGIDAELTRHNYGMIIGNLDSHLERERSFVEIAFSGAVDGILLLSLRRLPRDETRTIAMAGLPMIALCEALPDVDFPQVTVRNKEASVAVVAHLAALGHRRIGHIGGPPAIFTAQQRASGFAEGLLASGIDPAGCPLWGGTYHFDSGYDAGRAFMAMRERPTAVFAANDEMAVGFMKCIHDNGLRVPGDVSVAGFDGVPYARFAIPTLTTVVQPRIEIGAAAAGLLVRRMAGEETGAAPCLEAPLSIHASTGPPPARRNV